MKIGVLTYHRSHNYGAFLQAYSLSHALNKIEGVNCEIINYNLASEDGVYKKRIIKRPIYALDYIRQDRMFNNSQKEQLLSGELVLCNDYEATLKLAEEKYDVVIAGSDEIWRIATRGFPNIYWLPGDRKFKKMSYAASGRMTLDEVTDEQKVLLAQFYEDFEYIGVRDEATKEFVQALVPAKQVHRNCDPAFLYDRFKEKNNLKKHICEKYRLGKNKKIVAIMYDRPNVITQLRKRLGKEYTFVCVTRPMYNADRNITTVTPFEWVDVLGGCDYLVSSYYHGMLFALNQNTPFLVIDRRATRNSKNTSKLCDFLEYTGMEERYYISQEIDEEKWDEIAEKIKSEIVQKSDFSDVVSNQRKLFEEFTDYLMEK
ncbi:MAG: polysaccharide pyruvyl transferase family protein [Lachnospiraceae bacterium]|nr:polysaccharide pyruvyl transferase family protein [Lachnospiraceae bacterium]